MEENLDSIEHLEEKRKAMEIAINWLEDTLNEELKKEKEKKSWI